MYMDRVLQNPVGGLGIDYVQYAVDRLIPADAQNRGSEYRLGLGIHQDLHEALGLALFDGAPNPRHRPHPDADLVTGSASVALVEPRAAERRVGIKRIGRHPVAHSSRLMVEKIRGD